MATLIIVGVVAGYAHRQSQFGAVQAALALREFADAHENGARAPGSTRSTTRAAATRASPSAAMHWGGMTCSIGPTGRDRRSDEPPRRVRGPIRRRSAKS